ncbi:TerC family protein [Companilactobacillus halodurans]|uniref:TerC family protein n=1 Tax=Companilactobacillus halodurans TaxID=2584183 RepID=A0A5P0ZQX5_9LACO|nr:TerC family protein [Companilactobacillus halodurans]MQS76664.1 TerC family protein [Companilactobacillus halodurans]MQS98290.1 TerC family protein [Companilactobacillus halodurans]
MNALVNMYGPFFDLNNWATVIESGEDWLVILSLVVMECILSVDNAVVLAAQTQSLPNKVEQEKSLFYGLFGAYIFRFLVIGIGVYLIDFWLIKVFGALYLFYLFIKHFFLDRNKKVEVPKERKKPGNALERHLHISNFWQVVISIELMDIVFSIDSVLASLAVSSNPVIVLIGGMIGILAMRGIAELIMGLMNKIPELNGMAYFLILFISIKLFLSIPAIDIEIPNLVFVGVLVAAIIVTLIIHQINNNKAPKSKKK